ncbi:MAG: MBL fold metallo-hydrolase [bacterium]|nr:MBL fold metallo-hydrolase [bacterium]
MQLQFCGGAQTVTGSQHLLKVNGKSILLECGLFQGRRQETYEKNQNFCFDPSTVDVMVLSHAHIDHSGNIPNLVRNGFDGQIFATAATVDLCQIMLRDSAYLQGRDIVWANKIRKRQNLPPVEPLYTISDVEKAMSLFVGIQYDRTFQICPGVQATFRDSGHILGSAGVLLEIEEDGKKIRLGFSGDIGRTDVPILRDPNVLRDIDVLIMESTYGNRLHGPREDVEEELAEAIQDVAKSGGKVVIPAFAVGRTQLVVYMLHKLFDQGRIPDMPVFVDSPLATAATQVFRSHPECFDQETYRMFLEDHQDPFGFKRLKYISSVEESKKLNDLKYPHIIISASGMAEGGRIVHHLRNNIGDPRTLVLLVGYAAEHTLARRIMDGNKEVKIFGEAFQVRCKVKTMDAFSAHADRNELLAYVDYTPPEKLKQIFLVHGEAEQALPLKEALEKKGYGSVHYPAPNDTFEI